MVLQLSPIFQLQQQDTTTTERREREREVVEETNPKREREIGKEKSLL